MIMGMSEMIMEIMEVESIPKVLFTDRKIHVLSTEAKVLYGLLLDRVSLSKERYLWSVEKWQAAILTKQIDQFSYDYDTYQYQDTVEDREAQVANIMEDIRNGNSGYLNDFLNTVIAEGVRGGIADIFGQGTPPDDSEAVQTIRKAQEILDKLSEYKPLANVEELEENNYNMIDNVLNNDSSQKEERRVQGRISVKEKLAEKKAIIEQRDMGSKSVPEKDTEKKNQREI